MPTAPGLVRALMRSLAEGTALEGLRGECAKLTWPRLESTLQELHYCVGDLAIGALAPLTAGTPNAYHRFLATQLSTSKILYTTNQDELIECALTDVGLQMGRDFRIWVPGEPWLPSGMPTIVKLHGTASNVTSIRSTLRQVHQGLPTDIATQLANDLRDRTTCFLGYSGNDIDIRPVLHATTFHDVLWVTRSGTGLPLRLANQGKRVRMVRADLRGLLNPSSPLSDEVEHPEVSALDAFARGLDPFLRMCAVSRCVGSARPYNSDLHRQCIQIAGDHAKGHPDAWRVHYDAGDRRNNAAGGFGGVLAFRHYGNGYRLARGRDPIGAVLCLRGMWMSCDLLLLGLFRTTYRPGLRFCEPRARQLLADIGPQDREYFTGLINLLQLRALLKLRRFRRGTLVARSLVQASASSPHLRGHGLRFLARANALQGQHQQVELLLASALEEFEYAESVVDQRNVHRIGVLCALDRHDASAAKSHLQAVGELGSPDARERARNRLLAVALWCAQRGWWRVAKSFADRV